MVHFRILKWRQGWKTSNRTSCNGDAAKDAPKPGNRKGRKRFNPPNCRRRRIENTSVFSQSAATATYFKLEKEHPKDDIVLVNADTFDSIRTAYRNYFSDVNEFVKYIDGGCQELKSSSGVQKLV
jgi:hypothetical protein